MFNFFKKKIQGLSCPECDEGTLIYQTGWTNGGMIEYKICLSCKYIEIMTQGATIEDIKYIEFKKGNQ